MQNETQTEQVNEQAVTEVQTEVPNEKEQTEQTVPEKIEAQAPKQPDPVAQMRQRIAIETRRIQAIRKICNGEYPDIEANAIENGWDINHCELEVLRAARPAAPAIKTSAPQLDRNILLATAALAGQADEAVMLKAYGERALNEADRYMLRHWQKLTLFLRQPGAPLDNNICERALKKAILHRTPASTKLSTVPGWATCS